MKSYVVHAKNKYPNHQVISDYERFVKVVDELSGDVICGVEKDGAGNFNFLLDDAKEKFDLSPLPSGTTFLKLNEFGKVVNDAKATDKLIKAKELADKYGKVPSCIELVELTKESEKPYSLNEKEKRACGIYY